VQPSYLFFSIMVAGLSSSLHASLTDGLTAAGLSSASAAKVANLPPVSVLFAAFLGYNPMQALLGPPSGRCLRPARRLSPGTSSSPALSPGRSTRVWPSFSPSPWLSA
jgi:hypothetical protein